MGKKKKRKPTNPKGYQKATGTRTFDGKKYTYATSFRDKKEAKHWAQTLREKKGVNARVVKGKHDPKGYTVYRVYGRSKRAK